MFFFVSMYLYFRYKRIFRKVIGLIIEVFYLRFLRVNFKFLSMYFKYENDIIYLLYIIILKNKVIRE